MDGVSGEDERVARQIAMQRDVYASGVPAFGSCWALQIAVVAAGGACRKSPHGREQGIGRKNALTDAGAAHPMFVGKPRVFDVASAHFDEVGCMCGGAPRRATSAAATLMA